MKGPNEYYVKFVEKVQKAGTILPQPSIKLILKIGIKGNNRVKKLICKGEKSTVQPKKSQLLYKEKGEIVVKYCHPKSNDYLNPSSTIIQKFFLKKGKSELK
jgi:hypothetical protein